MPVLDDDTEETLTERIKVAERRQLVEQRRPAGPRGLDHHRKEGHDPVSDARAARRPIRRALVSVYDKTGLVELAAGPARRRRGDRVDRLDRAARSRPPACR